MKRCGRYVIVLACLLGMTGCIVKGSITFSNAFSLMRNVTIANPEGSFEMPEVKETEQPMDYTVWGEEKQKVISDEENTRKSIVNILTICGSSEYLFPYGKVLHQEDKEGCLIGKKTAEKLFGSHKAEGLILKYNNKEFQVRGVFDKPEEILVIQKGEEIEGKLNRVTVRREKGERAAETARRFGDTYGIYGEVLRWDYYQSLTWILEMIPGKWSDFDGFRKNFESKKEEFQILSYVEKSTMETLYIEEIRKALYHIILSGIFFLEVIVAGKRGILKDKNVVKSN